MALGPAIGALMAGSANNVMPVTTPNNDFNAKPVNVRVMMCVLRLPSRRQINEATALRVPSNRGNVSQSADFSICHLAEVTIVLMNVRHSGEEQTSNFCCPTSANEPEVDLAFCELTVQQPGLDEGSICPLASGARS
jgi:hypothetical protein